VEGSRIEKIEVEFLEPPAAEHEHAPEERRAAAEG
jgi:hypothetical protein